MPEMKFDLNTIGRLMHESWSKTKRAQGFHGPQDCRCLKRPHPAHVVGADWHCEFMHLDLIPWEQLPEKQKDINRHAFDAVLPYFEQKIREAKAEAYQDALQWVLAEAQACGCSERIAASIRACKEGG